MDSNLQIGQIRTIGTSGPKYEIIGPGGRAENGELLIKVAMIENGGEQVEYPMSSLSIDPEA